MKDMNLLWGRLLDVVLLLVGIFVFNFVVGIIVPWMLPNNLGSEDFLILFGQYYPWIGQLCFGLIISFKLRNSRVAAPVGLLSVLIPVYGALFYLLSSTLIPLNDE